MPSSLRDSANFVKTLKIVVKLILNCLRPHAITYTKRDTHFPRKAVPLQQRVAVTLWKLATNVVHRILAQLMGTGCSTACEIVNSVCEAITCHLFSRNNSITSSTSRYKYKKLWKSVREKGVPPGNWRDRWLPCTNYLSKR